jgi:hypothetical protein
MDEAKATWLTAKEWLVALPIFGTTLAVTYDVGFFLRYRTFLFHTIHAC